MRLEYLYQHNKPIQEKTESYMEARPKGPSAFAAPGGKNKWLSKKSFKMKQVDIEVVKLTPDDRTGA